MDHTKEARGEILKLFSEVETTRLKVEKVQTELREKLERLKSLAGINGANYEEARKGITMLMGEWALKYGIAD